MKRPTIRRAGSIILAFACLCSAAGAASSGERLQQALYNEEIEGNLEAAIAEYDQVINDTSAPSKHVAQALYRQGMCYIRLGDEVKAAEVLERLVTDHTDQEKLVADASPVLESIRFYDPASLMPSETLAYLELGRIGSQIDTVLEMLKGTPLEDPLQLFAQQNPQNQGPEGALVAGLLNPAMQADFKKIRSLAIGFVDVQPDRPDLVAALHLGESAMLRTLLMTGLSMVGTPSGMVDGMQTYSIQGQAGIACDGQVFLLTFPSGRLQWMIRQYKNPAADASLASGNASFGKMDKRTRSENLATLWVGPDDLYARMLQQIPQLPRELQMQAGMINVQSIDDLMLTASLATNAIALDGRIMFKEDMQNMMYEMIKTPVIRREGLKGVPADAFSLASFDFAGADSMQAAQLRQLVLTNTGLDLPPELFECIEQVTLFALPCTNITPDASNQIRPGLAVTCSDPAPVAEFLATLQPMITESTGLQLVLDTVDNTVLMAMEPKVLDLAKAAMMGKASANNEGLLAPAIGDQLETSGKLVLINASGLMRWAAGDNLYVLPHPVATEEDNRQLAAAFEQLAGLFEGTTFSIRTEESANELALKARLNGMPRFSALLEPIARVNELNAGINEKYALLREQERKQRVQEGLASLRTATIACIADESAPGIDGELDDVWNDAPAHAVDRPVKVLNEPGHGSPVPGSTFVAEFRTLHDSTNLYVFIDVTDSTPNHNPNLSWQFSDNVVLYLDATEARHYAFQQGNDYEFAFCWDASAPVMQEKKWHQDEPIQYVIKTTGKGYCVEAALPLAALGTPDPIAGRMIGLDIQVSDNQAGTQRNAMLGWQDDTNDVWQDPTLFGRGQLAGSKE